MAVSAGCGDGIGTGIGAGVDSAAPPSDGAAGDVVLDARASGDAEMDRTVAFEPFDFSVPERAEQTVEASGSLDRPFWFAATADETEGFVVTLDGTSMRVGERALLAPLVEVGTSCRGQDGAGFTYCLRARGEARELVRWRGKTIELLIAFDDATFPGLGNDWVVASNGVVYFSNRCDGAPRCRGSGSLGSVYRWNGTAIEEVHRGLPNPNGVGLTPGEGTLLVAASSYDDRSRAGVYALPRTGEDLGPTPNERLLPLREPDGIAVDAMGRVFARDGSRVAVSSSAGDFLGEIGVRGSLTNCAVGGPEGDRVLMISTRDRGLYRAFLDGRASR